MSSKKYFLCLSLIFIFLSLTTHAGEILESKISGEGCESNGKIDLKPKNHILEVPLQGILDKSKKQDTARIACQFAIKTKVGPHEKVVIKDLEQNYEIKLGAKTKVQSEIEIFISAENGSPLKVEELAKKKSIFVKKKFEKKGIIVQSKCGQPATLRGLLSTFATGENEAHVVVSPMKFIFQFETCQ